MELAKRRQLSKKLYYRYFDLSQSAKFLGDAYTIHYSNEMMNCVIKYVKSGALFGWDVDTLLSKGIEKRLISDIIELNETGNLSYVLNYKERIPRWLHRFISPLYLDIECLRKYLVDNDINSEDDLHSVVSKKNILTDFEYSLKHILNYMSDEFFPNDYIKSFPQSDIIKKTVGDEKICGILHNHTIYSDGQGSIEEIANFAQAFDYEYIGISDHSQSTILGMSYNDYLRQSTEIEEYLSNHNRNINIIKGIECEILSNGELDYTTEQLRTFDYVIVGIHTNYDMNRNDAMQRIIRAIENPYTDILAHPSCRIYGSKPGFPIDMRYIIDACVYNNVIIEINGNIKRMDLDPKYVNYAADKGALFELASDTHSYKDFIRINNAVRVAEDYMVPSSQIINLKNINEIQTLFQNIHSQKR